MVRIHRRERRATVYTNNTAPAISGTTDAVSGSPLTVTVAGQTLTTTVQAGGTWSVTPDALADGSYTVGASVTDTASGKTGTATQALTIDTAAPVVGIDGGASALTNNPAKAITGTTDAATGTTVTVTVAGQTLTTTVHADGSWSVSPAALTDGSYTVTVTVTDPAGNTGTATQTLTVASPALLATTGTDLQAPLLAGLVLAFAGATLLLASRRRRRGLSS